MCVCACMYQGTAQGLDFEAGLNTFWAPDVVRGLNDGLWHMHVTYVAAVKHRRRHHHHHHQTKRFILKASACCNEVARRCVVASSLRRVTPACVVVWLRRYVRRVRMTWGGKQMIAHLTSTGDLSKWTFKNFVEAVDSRPAFTGEGRREVLGPAASEALATTSELMVKVRARVYLSGWVAVLDVCCASRRAGRMSKSSSLRPAYCGPSSAYL